MTGKEGERQRKKNKQPLPEIPKQTESPYLVKTTNFLVRTSVRERSVFWQPPANCRKFQSWVLLQEYKIYEYTNKWVRQHVNYLVNMNRGNIACFTDILKEGENINFSEVKAPQVTEYILGKLWKWCISRNYVFLPLESF
jgi:hypothetical protein